MSWFSFFMFCTGLHYLSRLILGVKKEFDPKKDDWSKIISNLLVSVAINFIAWICLKNSIPELIIIAKEVLEK